MKGKIRSVKTYHLSDNKPVVAHSVSCWLPLTMTWVYNQVKHMVDFDSIILANSTQNLRQFPWHSLYVEEGIIKKYAFKVARKLKLMHYPFVYDEAIKIHRPSIIHSHFGDQGWRDLHIAKKYGIKHVVTFYGYDVNMLPTQHPIWKERYQQLFKRADLFLCEGPHMAECVLALGCPESKIKVQRLGIDLDKIPFVPRKIGKDGVLKILIAGTFREKKGIPYALEAIALLKNKYTNIQVTIIGDSTGHYKEKIEKSKILDVIKRYELEPLIRMLGFQPHDVLMKEAYDHHIFLSPSVTSSDGDTEGGAPVTIIEMAASGMPVVSTLHCDIPFVLGAMNKSHLAVERDAYSLMIEMCNYYHMLKSSDNVMIEGNRVFIENELAISCSTKRLKMLYESILRNSE
jgi:colanic acid/amylovoran biosynthesis glycosyltransferase